jgi:Phytanoyl-CoA dioxygenase (PhyH)
MHSLNGPAFVNLEKHGAQLFSGAVTHELTNLKAALKHLPSDNAGIRITGNEKLRPFLGPEGAVGSIAASIIGPTANAVRAILFDKTAKTNWSLKWHQDRTICVKRKSEVDGFGQWTVKSGMQHVAPPIEILSRMVTLRVHLDDVPATNAPLLIALGSHTCGLVPEAVIPEVVERCGVVACIAKAGDVWVYSTPILHASEASSHPMRRRVLQIDYAAKNLPDGLEWLGI